jgi:hypothetical protein
MITPYTGTPESMNRVLHALAEPVFMHSVVPKRILAKRLLAADTMIAHLDDPQKGIVLLEDCRPNENANITFIFWDRRLNDKLDLALDAMACASELFELRRLTAFAPGRNPVYDKFLRSLDFRQEGCLRRYIDQDRDCFVYGIMRSKIYGRLATNTAQPGVLLSGHTENVHASPAGQHGPEPNDRPDERIRELAPQPVLTAAAIIRGLHAEQPTANADGAAGDNAGDSTAAGRNGTDEHGAAGLDSRPE